MSIAGEGEGGKVDKVALTHIRYHVQNKQPLGSSCAAKELSGVSVMTWEDGRLKRE